MKNLLIAVVLSLGLFSAMTMAEQGIEVVGKAEVLIQPDVFNLTISIKERGRSASKTKAIVDHKSEQITRMFLKEGIQASAIDSSQLTMYPIYEKRSITPKEVKTKISDTEKVTFTTSEASNDNIQNVTLFEVGRTITVTFNEWNIYDKVLDQVVKLGVSHVSPMEMTFKDPEKYYQQALFQAIEDAQQKATKIAQQANVELGKLVSLKETGYHAPARYRMMSEASVGFNSTTTKKAVSAQVIAIYDIKH